MDSSLHPDHFKGHIPTVSSLPHQNNLELSRESEALQGTTVSPRAAPDAQEENTPACLEVPAQSRGFVGLGGAETWT